MGEIKSGLRMASMMLGYLLQVSQNFRSDFHQMIGMKTCFASVVLPQDEYNKISFYDA